MLTHGNYRQVVTHARVGGRGPGGRGHLPLPPARPRLRAAHPARQLRHRHDHRVLRRRQHADRARAPAGPADLPAQRAAHLREDLHARALLPAGRGPGAHAGRGQARRQGPRPADPRRGGPARAAGALRAGRGAALQQRARDLRRAPAPGRQRRRPDRQGDPRVLLRLRRARARGLRHDRDGHGGHLLDDRAPPLRIGGPHAAGRRRADRRRRRAAASRARTSSRATGATTTPASAPSSTAGCTPATWARSTRTATSTSRAARRTSSSPPAART